MQGLLTMERQNNDENAALDPTGPTSCLKWLPFLKWLPQAVLATDRWHAIDAIPDLGDAAEVVET